jgi:hypothetical protein
MISVRLEIGWGLKILHGIRSELKRSADLNQQYKKWDRSYFTGQILEFFFQLRRVNGYWFKG